ncbi:MAG: pantoate--beta-alanine ligase [Proteobacteria bacterium]|nr:pantoate--beta-alanine ligase [Pseudomonadota bacterium]
MPDPVILDSIAALRMWREERRAAGRRIGLVPTMGALHAGHLSLVSGVKRVADEALVSIFVNPTQFAPNEDFSKYPRTFNRDVELLSEVGAEAVFAPRVLDMYPEGFATAIEPGGPAKAGLEDAFRPTHFAGVATVVTKLLLQCLPEVAIFGEKDFQQLAVIRHVARDLDIPVEILGGATVREADGLAMSSRNVYLSKAERGIAPVLHQVLLGAAEAIRGGTRLDVIEGGALRELSSHGFITDYVAIRDAATLGRPEPGARPESLRILVAAKLGATRLIDNIAAG